MTHGTNTPTCSAGRSLILPQQKDPYPPHHCWCGVPQSLLMATKGRDTELSELVAIRDFWLSTNQNIIIRSSHSQLVQIVTKTTNIRIENPDPNIRTWTWIWLDIATNNQQQTKLIGNIKVGINFEKIHKKRIDGRKEVQPAELPYQVRLNNPQVGLGPGRRYWWKLSVITNPPMSPPSNTGVDGTEEKRNQSWDLQG